MLLWFCKICFLWESIQRKLTPLVETWWPYDLWAGLSVNRSAFVTWSGHVFCSCAKHFSVTVPLSTQEYKWVAKISQGSLKNVVGEGGGNHGMDWHPIKGGVVKLLVASCEDTRFISSGPCDFVSVYPSHSQPKGKTHLFCYWIICWTDIYHHLQPSFFRPGEPKTATFGRGIFLQLQWLQQEVRLKFHLKMKTYLKRKMHQSLMRTL